MLDEAVRAGEAGSAEDPSREEIADALRRLLELLRRAGSPHAAELEHRAARGSAKDAFLWLDRFFHEGRLPGEAGPLLDALFAALH